MIVYTFWEPREKMPYYIQLCMETWKKFLPNAEIVLLDYKNIGDYVDIDKEIGSNLLGGRFKLSLIADAIRAALLAKHGGVWMDADTIILSSDAEKYFLPDEKNRTVFFGYPKSRKVHLAFINAPPNSLCMNKWLEFIQKSLVALTPETAINDFFLGNSFINPFLKEHVKEAMIFDANLIMPELKLIPHGEIRTLKRRRSCYAPYYFQQNNHLTDIDSSMILLHNSWTPRFYKVITPEILLRRDCTMTNILAEALDIKLPPPQERLRLKVENNKWVAIPNNTPTKA